MSSDIHCSNQIAIHVKGHPQIGLDFNGVHGPTECCRQAVDLMRAEPRVEWIDLKNPPSRTRGFLLRGTKAVKVPPKRFRGFESHLRGGGTSRRAVSISTTRPSSWSSTPCQKASGTSGYWTRRRNRSSERRSSGAMSRIVASSTRARSLKGKTLSSAITWVAVMTAA